VREEFSLKSFRLHLIPFFVSREGFFASDTSSILTERVIIDPKFSGEDHFYVKKIWSDKKKRFVPVNRDFWAAGHDGRLYFNFAFCKKIESMNLFV
jgi:hypothetical protein